MHRIVHKARSFEEAAEHDVRQQLAMTPRERVDAARELQRRFYGPPKDIRESRMVRKFFRPTTRVE
ncbi:MAG: hypothetical protein R6V58_14535 [Planctomycetota bacterium]